MLFRGPFPRLQLRKRRRRSRCLTVVCGERTILASKPQGGYVMRFTPIFLASALSSSLLFATPVRAQLKSIPVSIVDSDRDRAHASPDWQLIRPHLPDPLTANADILETEGDVLRVRRFPEDALDYYGYAIKRGGDKANLLNKIGVTQLELGNVSIARAYFDQVVKLRAKDPQAWNNLGAVQFMDRNYIAAIHDYKRAIKLNKRFAVSHSNLAMAYIEQKDFSSAKGELVLAVKLDPQIFQHAGAGGVSVHMMSAVDRANFCFQMAKVYARMGDEAEMIRSLEVAAQGGYDVRYEMGQDRDLAKFVGDPRVVNLLMVAKSLREGRMARGAAVAAALPPAAPSTTAVPSAPVQ